MNQKERLTQILNEKGIETIKGKTVEVDGYLVGGRKIAVIYIADDERTILLYREQMIKEHDGVSFGDVLT